MRLTAPRIEPLDLDALDDAQKEVRAPLIGTGRVLNIFCTLAHAPKALERFLQWGNYILSNRNSLSARDRNWSALDFLTDRQKMDLVFTIGQYTQVSMFLNSFGVQVDEGQTLDPALKYTDGHRP